MRTLLTTLTALMLFATPVVAEDGDKPDCVLDTGRSCEAVNRKQDKYDISINLFELGNVQITEFKAEQVAAGGGMTNSQRISGNLNGKYFHVLLQQSAYEWGELGTPYATKQEFKNYLRQKTIKSLERVEHFNHRRSSVAFITMNNGEKCVYFRHQKGEKLFIKMGFCNYRDQEVNHFKNYLSNKVRLVTRSENKAAYQNAHTTAAESAKNSSSTVRQSLADKSEEKICKYSLPIVGAGTGWDTGPGFRKYVTEAKRRGYTPQSCAKALGRTPAVTQATPSRASAEDKSFKRKMCESSKSKPDMHASFMQSLSQSELSKFLGAS